MHKDHKYKGVTIHYDENGEYNIAFYKLYYWYINITNLLENGSKKTNRKYFPTIADAKRFIDGY